MRDMFDKPQTVYGILVPLLIGLWFLSSLARGRTPSDPGALYRIGATAWFFFGLTLVLTLLFSLAVLVRRRTGARRATS